MFKEVIVVYDDESLRNRKQRVRGAYTGTTSILFASSAPLTQRLPEKAFDHCQGHNTSNVINRVKAMQPAELWHSNRTVVKSCYLVIMYVFALSQTHVNWMHFSPLPMIGLKRWKSWLPTARWKWRQKQLPRLLIRGNRWRASFPVQCCLLTSTVIYSGDILPKRCTFRELFRFQHGSSIFVFICVFSNSKHHALYITYKGMYQYQATNIQIQIIPFTFSPLGNRGWILPAGKATPQRLAYRSGCLIQDSSWARHMVAAWKASWPISFVSKWSKRVAPTTVLRLAASKRKKRRSRTSDQEQDLRPPPRKSHARRRVKQEWKENLLPLAKMAKAKVGAEKEKAAKENLCRGSSVVPSSRLCRTRPWGFNVFGRKLKSE